MILVGSDDGVEIRDTEALALAEGAVGAITRFIGLGDGGAACWDSCEGRGAASGGVLFPECAEECALAVPIDFLLTGADLQVLRCLFKFDGTPKR